MHEEELMPSQHLQARVLPLSLWTHQPPFGLKAEDCSSSQVVWSVRTRLCSTDTLLSPQSTWYSKALENGKRWQIWLKKKTTLICTVTRKKWWITLRHVNFGTDPLPNLKGLHGKGICLESHKQLKESNVDGTFTWSSQYDKLDDPNQDIQEAKWCSQSCLLLD